jgi:hypothetical protein
MISKECFRSKRWLWLILILFVQFSAVSQNQDVPKVLFVGNSYTYFWNLPQTVQAMASSQDFPLIAMQSTAGGATWKNHWEGEKGLKSVSIIKEGNWDVIILQNHSLSTVENLEQFMEYGSKLVELSQESGAKVMLYQTWARKHNPLMIEKIRYGYDLLAEKYGIEVVPVGEIWSEVIKLRPDLELYDPDGSHPSTNGTYLAACIFYSILTESSSAPIEKRIKMVDEKQQPFYLAIMSQENADFLQEVVDSFLLNQSEDE